MQFLLSRTEIFGMNTPVMHHQGQWGQTHSVMKRWVTMHIDRIMMTTTSGSTKPQKATITLRPIQY
jgi:hypothetical protein